MRTWCLALACAAVLGAGRPARAGEVVIPAQVVSSIQAETTKPLKQLTLDKTQMGQTQTRVRAWVGRSMDLSKATKRVSARTGRTSYLLQSKADTLRSPAARRTAAPAPASAAGRQRGAVRPQPRAARPRAVASSLRLMYREGPGHLKFQKVGTVRARTRLAKTEAIQLAQQFLVSNQLLKQTQFDGVSKSYVRERRISERRGADDYLVQQDVIFERQVEGKPVINSKLAVGFAPDTKEIVLLEHFNWTPVQQEGAAPAAGAARVAPRAAVGGRAATFRARAVAAPSATALRSRVEAKIRAISAQGATRAEVVKAFPAWFQTQDSLLPVLVLEVSATVAGPRGSISEPYVEVINLAGSDDALYPGRRPPAPPRKAS